MDVLEKIKQNGNQSAALLPKILEEGGEEFKLRYVNISGSTITFTGDTAETLDSIINAYLNGKTIKSVALTSASSEQYGWLSNVVASFISISESRPGGNDWRLKLIFNLDSSFGSGGSGYGILLIEKQLGKALKVKAHNYTDLIDLTVN